MCKLFGYNAGSSSEFCNQLAIGFDDWKNASVRIISHEKSRDHKAALPLMLQGKKSTRIDSKLQKEDKYVQTLEQSTKEDYCSDQISCWKRIFFSRGPSIA